MVHQQRQEALDNLTIPLTGLFWLRRWKSNPLLEVYETRDLTICPPRSM